MMVQGKKATSVRIIYDAIDKIRRKTEKEPLEVFS
jgi:ribosomal protein S7